MSAYFLQTVALLATAVIFMRVEPVINLMGPACRTPVRVAFWSLLVGAAGLGLSITQGYRPNGWTVLLTVGVAALLLSERRVRGLLRARENVTRDRRARP